MAAEDVLVLYQQGLFCAELLHLQPPDGIVLVQENVQERSLVPDD